MLIDRSHLSWALFSGISLIAGAVSYVAYAWDNPKGPSGGSAMGLLFGVIGTLMMLFASLLAARKPLRIRRIGSAQFWLKGHLWLGTLCIPFILFHAGFGWGGLLEQIMWYTLAIVAVSGFFGLAIQQFLPRLLWNRTPLETFEAQTPYQCDRMTFIADLRIAGLCESPLEVSLGHLGGHFSRLVAGHNSIMNGPGTRSEQNSRKLLLLQQVSPPEVRDFFWAMAKYAKSEAKVIRFEGDFPELLATTYAGLKETIVETAPQTVSPKRVQHAPAAALEGPKPFEPAAADPQAAVVAAEPPKLSPIEMMMKKSAERAKANDGDEGSPSSISASIPAKIVAVNPRPTSTGTAKDLSPKSSVVTDLAAAGTSPPNRPAPTLEKSLQPTVLERQLLRSVYMHDVRPFLAENRSHRSVLKSPLASAVEARRLFHQQESTLPATLHPVLEELEEFCEIRRQIELQRQILRWMHWWLMIHVPAAVAMLIFLIAHIVMALRIIPFPG